MKLGTLAGIVVGSLSLMYALRPPSFPETMPIAAPTIMAAPRQVPLIILYDEELAARLHPKQFIRRVVEEHNQERRRLRNEEYRITAMGLLESDNTKDDSSWFLSEIMRKYSREGATVAYLMGQPTFFYTREKKYGTGGMASRGYGAFIQHIPPTEKKDGATKVMNHEAFHLDEANDLNLTGPSFYATMTPPGTWKMNFDIDFGNEQIIKESTLQQERKRPVRPFQPSINYVRSLFKNPEEFSSSLEDIVLHESILTNPGYRAAIEEVEEKGEEKEAGALQRWREQHERKPTPLPNKQYQEVADAYYAADKAFKRGDLAIAYERLDAAAKLYDGTDLRINNVFAAAERAIEEAAAERAHRAYLLPPTHHHVADDARDESPHRLRRKD